jgi:predicted tellurium resistance membrane protein TerC
MLELLSDPAVWASFLTLTILEIVLGVDNVIFISIASQKLPPHQQKRARFIGLSGALVLRILLLLSITWIIGLTEPIATIFGFAVSWRDILLLGGGLFLIWKATTEIFNEMEPHDETRTIKAASFASVIFQIMLLDLVFSFDSVITAVGIADHVEVMIAAVIIAIIVMMIAAEPISAFVSRHASTKMLALAFLVMVGMALIADGMHVHVERGFIYAAMVFAGGVEALNLYRGRRIGAGAKSAKEVKAERSGEAGARGH